MADQSSGDEYAKALHAGIRDGSIIDPDLWLNPETDEVEVRPTPLSSLVVNYLRAEQGARNAREVADLAQRAAVRSAVLARVSTVLAVLATLLAVAAVINFLGRVL